MGVRVVSSCRDDAPHAAQLQIDAALVAYGRIFPASAPPPLFDEVLPEWRDRLDGDATPGATTLVPPTTVAVGPRAVIGAGAEAVAEHSGVCFLAESCHHALTHSWVAPDPIGFRAR